MHSICKVHCKGKKQWLYWVRLLEKYVMTSLMPVIVISSFEFYHYFRISRILETLFAQQFKSLRHNWKIIFILTCIEFSTDIIFLKCDMSSFIIDECQFCNSYILKIGLKHITKNFEVCKHQIIFFKNLLKFSFG